MCAPCENLTRKLSNVSFLVDMLPPLNNASSCRSMSSRFLMRSLTGVDAFGDVHGVLSLSFAGIRVCRRSRAIAMYSSSRSMPMYRRPSSFAATAVVPEPRKGSRIVSPGRLNEATHHFITSRAFCVGWPPRSLLSRTNPRQRLLKTWAFASKDVQAISQSANVWQGSPSFFHHTSQHREAGSMGRNNYRPK